MMWRTAVLTVLLLAAPVLGQGEPPPVAVSARIVPDHAPPGAKVTLQVTATVAEGYHIYGVPPVPEGVYGTRAAVVRPRGWKEQGGTRGPEPKWHDDPSLGTQVPWHSGTATFEQDVLVPADAAPGPVTLVAGLDHMACTDTYCLDPATLEVEVAFTVDAGKAAPPPEEPAAPAPPSPPAAASGGAASGSLVALLIAAFLGGLGSVLLPCVYPLIPLTLAFFSKSRGTRAATVGRALLFCAGIVATFTLLGVLLGPALQALAASLWLNVFLLFLMLALALSLLGWFDIRLPAAWTERMQSAGSGATLAAPVFMGLAFSLASFTCTVGVIGPILAAASSEWVRSAAGMFAYSAGFSLPFFVLALFPALLASLPKGGGWLNTTKVMLGFFELCFAGYYLWRVDVDLGWGIGSWPVVLSLWIVTVFLAGLYLLGKLVLPHDRPSERTPVPRLAGAVLCFALAVYLFGGLLNQVRLPGWVEGLLPPRETEEVAAAGTALPRPDFADDTFHPGYGGLWWSTDYDRALEIGRRTGRRVFLNFTGIYCSNCRTMEKGIFPLPAVREALSTMVLVELWTDLPSDEAGRKFNTHTTLEQSRRYRDLRSAPRPEGFATTANPWYVIVTPDGRRLAETGYDSDAESFLRFLRTGS